MGHLAGSNGAKSGIITYIYHTIYIYIYHILGGGGGSGAGPHKENPAAGFGDQNRFIIENGGHIILDFGIRTDLEQRTENLAAGLVAW